MDSTAEANEAQAALRSILQRASSADPPGFRSIPVVDLGPSFSESLADRAAVAGEIRASCTSSGFFYVKNHGVPPRACEGVLEAARRFFHDLPADRKEKLHVRNSALFRGWRPPEDPAAAASRGVDPETKEAFNWAYQADLDSTGGDGEYVELDGSRTSRNVWPDEQDLPGFFAGIKPYYQEMLRLSRHMLRLFALSLALPETYFDHVATHPGGVARLLRYPGMASSPEPVEAVGIRPHRDFECFTILLQSHSSGLQVLSPDGFWVDAEPIQGTFVVNIGEIMTRMTNGIYKSTVHRVAQRSRSERYSIPFFFSVNYDSIVEPLPSCITAENPPRYARVTAGEYTIERLRLAVRNNE